MLTLFSLASITLEYFFHRQKSHLYLSPRQFQLEALSSACLILIYLHPSQYEAFYLLNPTLRELPSFTLNNMAFLTDKLGV